MTHEAFTKLQLELIDKVLKITQTKGKEYANNDDDRLANFKRAAQRKGITPLVALGIYLDKHMDSIDSYIKHERTFSEEAIEGRIVDAITYLTLMWGLIKEQTPKPYKSAYEVLGVIANNNPVLKPREDVERRHAMLKCSACGNGVPEQKFIFLTNRCVDCEEAISRQKA